MNNLNATYLYAESLGICALILGILVLLNLKYWRPKVLNSLSAIYILDFICCAVDLVWIFVDGKPEFTALNHVYDVISLSCPTGIGIAYLVHADKLSKSGLFTSVKKNLLWSILPVAVVALVATSPLTGLIYTVEAGAYVRGPLYFITYIVSYGYSAIGAILCLIAMKKTELYVEKRKLLILAVFLLPGLMLAILQSYVLPVGFPTSHLGVLISLLCYFACYQDEQITRDVLTGLPNRYSIDRIMLDYVRDQKFGCEKELWVLFGDLDGFKGINDTYGHSTGDRALKLTAEVMAMLGAKYNVTTGRYGGNEFVAVCEASDGKPIADLASDLPEALLNISEDEKYDLVISVGIAKYEKGWTVHQLMDAADAGLYRMKKEHKRI